MAKKEDNGNTRLPFGLCGRYGIPIGKDWTPRDAWEALRKKTGITPEQAYQMMSTDELREGLATDLTAEYSGLPSARRLANAARARELERIYADPDPANSPYQPQAFAAAVRRRLAQESDPDVRQRYQEYLTDVKNEPKISADMRTIADDAGSRLLGYQYRLKSTTGERFYQKIAEEPTKRNKDNVRYTMQLGDGVDEYHKAVEALKRKGYKPLAVKNYWLSGGYYKGINTQWESPDGTMFEIQFHSEHNLAVKEELHPLYERERDPNASAEEKKAARKKQAEISAKFKKPNGIEEVR